MIKGLFASLLNGAAGCLLIGTAGCTFIPTPADPAGYEAVTPAHAVRSLIPRDVLFSNPTRASVRISPDGRLLSWLAPRDGVMNIWIAPAEDPAGAHPVTNATGAGLEQYEWAPDSRHVIFLKDQDGDENWNVLAVDVLTREIRNLTPITGVSARIIGTSKLRPNIVLVELNDRDSRYHDLYEIEYQTGRRRLVETNPGFASWIVDRQLQPRFAMQQVAGMGVKVFRKGPGSWEEAFTIPEEDHLTTSAFGFNRDGDTVYWADSRGRNTAALLKMDAATGRTTVLAESAKADINSVVFDPISFEPVAYSENYLKTEWTGLNEKAAGDLDFLRRHLEGEIGIESLTEGGKAIVSSASAENPQTFYLFDRDERQLEKLFVSWPEIAAYDLQPMHPIIIQARDGLELPSYLTLPTGSDPDANGIPDRPAPMVLFVHGGPWNRDTYGYRPVHQWLADRGYAVLSVNFRGSTGLGKDFITAAVGEWAGKMHEDLVDAVRWSVSRGVADPAKVGIAGGSYGGYAALVGLTFTPDLFACGASLAAAYNIVTAIESFPPHWKPILANTWYRHLGDPADPVARADMLARSPITKVDAIRASLLIGHGENDSRVKKAEADRIVVAMQAKGLPVTYVNYPDEGHGLNRPENMRSFIAINEAFFAKCLGGRLEPFGNDLQNSSLQVLHGAEYIPGLREALAQLR